MFKITLPRRILLLAILVSILGFVILAIMGKLTSAPFAILLGTFIGGFATKDIKYGAAVGLFVALIVTVVFVTILAIIFFMALIFLISLVLVVLIKPLLSVVGLFSIYFIYVIGLSPLFGLLGGGIGRLVFGKKVEVAPQIPSTQFPVGYTGKILCPYCGTPNDPSNRFCLKCGSRLQ